uniref:C3H1-type domain-containing protein n=1 Tax=Hyaloperonospora arabidopsidis (strain Emoy2) TaxID=559515 RepID=M4BSK7_HYAAE
MPPKKTAGSGPSKKAAVKQKEKVLENKTFGLKNKKKSKNVQKYIQEVTKQVAGGTTRADRMKEQEAKRKKDAKAEQENLKSLFAASIRQPAMLTYIVYDDTAQLPPGTDPKSVLCAFFKAGVCTKVALWSVFKLWIRRSFVHTECDKLEEVVNEKHHEKNAKQTEIVCKHFLDAIEKSLYGWFWVCPNGGTSCKYRHALPVGYVFKSKKDRELEKGNKVVEVSIEEIIEQQRAKLGPNGGTPVTEESLAKWKADKLARKKTEEAKRLKEQAKRTGGRGIMSGRALFTYDPTLFRDDADADDEAYSVHSDEEEDSNEVPAVDAAAAVMDKSLYLQDVDDLDSLKK